MGYLRILLAMIVALGHLQAPALFKEQGWVSVYFVGSILAVKLFFIISGFYMAMIYDEYGNARAFWLSRSMRLFPAYWITLVIFMLIALTYEAPSFGEFGTARFWLSQSDLFFTFIWTLANVSFVGLDVGMWFCIGYEPLRFAVAKTMGCPDGMHILVGETMNQPAWTLALELYFYAMVPMIARWRERWVVALFLASMAITLFIDAYANAVSWNRSFFPAELHLFLMGFLTYRWRSYFSSWVSPACAVLALAMFVTYQHIPFLSITDPIGLNEVYYFMFALALPALFAFGRSLPYERVIGDLSYPVYISHAVIISLIPNFPLHKYMSVYPWIAFNALAVLAAAWLIMKASDPISTRRHIFRRRA